MFQQFTTTHKRLIFSLGVILVFGIASLIWLRPRTLALYHQVKGGIILAEIMRTYPYESHNDIACDLPPLENDPARAQLQQAISHLEAARNFEPQLAQTYLLLGRAYCLNRETENAIGAYLAYNRLRPRSTLGHFELGFAYAIVNEKMAVKEWQVAGIRQDHFLGQADQAFNRKNYLDSANRYRQSAMFDKVLSFPVYFRWAIAASISGQQLPADADQTLPVFAIPELGQIKIEAGYLRWLRDNVPNHLAYGDRLMDHPGVDRTVAWMWWSGDAVALIRVPEASKFAITIRAQNTRPPPIQVELIVDLEPVYPFAMQLGDMSWQEYKTEVFLSAGFHVIGLRYLNNGVVDGVDRDAVIDWIELLRK